ncbi:hypothetical protein AYI69_g11194 [Smittium culicis]|uniref:Uncharacterized protein n=1 Tax=Smittium culicis TaxID=133412 RepID=A0A1R1X0D9_9FUNG|nr:hypothetical protein AYI69_g11194 [Smittium culicis]
MIRRSAKYATNIIPRSHSYNRTGVSALEKVSGESDRLNGGTLNRYFQPFQVKRFSDPRLALGLRSSLGYRRWLDPFGFCTGNWDEFYGYPEPILENVLDTHAVHESFLGVSKHCETAPNFGAS